MDRLSQHSPDDRLADRLAITALNDRFGYFLDHGEVDAFVDLFTDDVAYSNGKRHLNGRSEMSDFFHRRAEGGRVSRHFYSGLQIHFTGEDEARGTSIWLTFAGAGALPIASAEPFNVADVEDVYRRTSDGTWLIAKRRISVVFLNDAVPQLPVTGGPDKR